MSCAPAGRNLTCPQGYYCKPGTREPRPCPLLTHCPEGSAKASLSWGGFLILVALLAVLSICYVTLMAIIRINQKRQLRTQHARDALWKMLSPLVASQQQQLRWAVLGGPAPQGSDLPRVPVGVTGRFEHSKVACVMGPSGAGKSTFLNVLMGKAKEYSRSRGRVRVNGQEMQLSRLQAITGFVPQEDIVHEDLTVRENLAFSARLRLSKVKPLAEQLAIVEDVLDVLQLRHVQHHVVGTVEKRGISGGQRKRTNIGWELAAKPSLLWMDEPTSGLDSTASSDILRALKTMAGLGMTVVTVIHQPRYSVFELFDEALFLGKGGRTVYLGPTQLALPYFESLGFHLPPKENPADFVLDVISGSVPRAGAESFQPEELFGLWDSYGGQAWVRTQSKVATEAGGAAPRVPEPPRVDPEGLRQLEAEFDAVDADGDGGITAPELRALLGGLGLDPSPRDVATLCAELAVGRTGLVSKAALVGYVRSGGRGAPAADAGGAGRPIRRNDSLYRVYSIEHYTLASGLSQLLTPGARPGASMKELAAAAAEAEAQPGAAPEAGPGGGAIAALPAGSAHIPSSGSTTADMEQHLLRASAASVEAGHHAASDHASHHAAGDGAAPAHGEREETPTAVHLPTPFAAAAAPEAAGVAGLQRDSTALESAPSSGRPSLVARPSLAAAGAKGEQRRGLLAWLEGSSLRATPGPVLQYGTLLVRAAIKFTRQWPSKAMDVLLLVFAGVVCGGMHGTARDTWQVRGHTALIFMVLGIVAAAVSLGVFARDRVVFWREKASGVSTLSYFLANTTVSLVDVLLQPAVFLSVYCALVLPAIPWLSLYVVGVLVVWYASSLGCLLSVLVSPSNSLVAAVAFTMVLSGFLNGVTPNYAGLSPAMKANGSGGAALPSRGRGGAKGAMQATVTGISYNRWAVESPEYLWPTTKSVMLQAGYCGLDALALPEGPGKADLAPGGPLEQLDVRVYCSNYVRYALLIMAAEGLYASRGLKLEPLLTAVSHIGGGFAHRCLRGLLSPSALLPSPLERGFLAGQQAPPSPGFGQHSFAVKEGRLSFDDILVMEEADSHESSQKGALECFLNAPRQPLGRAKSATQLDLFAAGPKPQSPELGLQAATTEAEPTLATKLAQKPEDGTQAQRIPAAWNDTEPSLELSFGPSVKVAGAAPRENASADEEASSQQATSVLKAAQPTGLDTAEDVRPRLVGTKRAHDGTAAPPFSFPDAAPAQSGDVAGARDGYDRMRELEAQVQQIHQIGDALRHAYRRASAQHNAAMNENQQLWALVAHLATCLRAGHAAQQAAAAAAAPEGGSPDLLLGPLFSPDDCDLAAAVGMFVSPGKALLHGSAAAATATNKPRKLFSPKEEACAHGGCAAEAAAEERAGGLNAVALAAPHLF
eukprot:scaffold3.g6238.t1